MKATQIPKHYNVNLTPGEMFTLAVVLRNFTTSGLALTEAEAEVCEGIIDAYQGDLPGVISEPLPGGGIFDQGDEGIPA